MKSNTKQALSLWINGAAPESAHPCDMNRFHNFVYECLINGENIDTDELADTISENLTWNDEKIRKFSEGTVIHIKKIMEFIDFLKSKKQINIYNLL